MSEFVPILPSGVHLDMPDFADIDNMSQTPECVSFGEPGSGTISPESGNVSFGKLGSGTVSPDSGNVMALSYFAVDIDAEPDEPFLPSRVHLDMP